MNTRGVSLLSAGSWVRAVSKNKGSKRRGVSVMRPLRGPCTFQVLANGFRGSAAKSHISGVSARQIE